MGKTAAAKQEKKPPAKKDTKSKVITKDKPAPEKKKFALGTDGKKIAKGTTDAKKGAAASKNTKKEKADKAPAKENKAAPAKKQKT